MTVLEMWKDGIGEMGYTPGIWVGWEWNEIMNLLMYMSMRNEGMGTGNLILQ
jgi:hypothetical protein